MEGKFVFKVEQSEHTDYTSGCPVLFCLFVSLIGYIIVKAVYLGFLLVACSTTTIHTYIRSFHARFCVLIATL